VHLVEADTALQAGRLWVRFLMGSLEFLIVLSLQPNYGPRVHSASNRNEYQGYLPGRGGLRRPVHSTDNLATFMCQLSKNSGSLNLLEP
jgi:hypothetical protein